VTLKDKRVLREHKETPVAGGAATAAKAESAAVDKKEDTATANTEPQRSSAATDGCACADCTSLTAKQAGGGKLSLKEKRTMREHAANPVAAKTDSGDAGSAAAPAPAAPAEKTEAELVAEVLGRFKWCRRCKVCRNMIGLTSVKIGKE
jgi:hypothetical protein